MKSNIGIALYEPLLNKVERRLTSYGEHFHPPCSGEGLVRLRRRAWSELGCEMLDGYERFLRMMDGLDWNGLVVYASERRPILGHDDRFVEGVVEANLNFRDFEPMKDYLVTADDGVVLFTRHLREGRFDVILRVGLTKLESFESFDELLTNALEGHI